MSDKTPAEIAQDEAFEQAKKRNSYNLLDPEQARKAKLLADAALKIADSKSPEEELKIAKEEAEDYKGKLEMIAMKELEKKIKNYSEELKVIFRNDPSKLLGYEMALKDRSFSSETPSGSAPLNDKQIYGQTREQSFESEKEMIDYLRKNKTPENEAILKKLFERMAQGIRERGTWVLPFENVNPKSNESDSNVASVEVNINSVKEGESEI